MKKLSLLLVVLLAAGSAGLYGQMAIGTNFSISGDATATVGYDIHDEQFGFKNGFNSNIKIELVAKQTANNDDKIGMSGWVGSIELKDFQILLDSGEEDSPKFVTKVDFDKKTVETKRTGLYIAPPTIVARLKNGPLWLQIYDKPSNKADLIPHVEEDEDNDRAAESHDKDKDVGSAAIPSKHQGVTFGYTTDDLSFAVGASSEESYDANVDPKKDATKNAETGSFAVSAEVKVNVGPATLDVAVVQGLENNEERVDMDNDDDTGLGVKLTTDFGDISVSAGADVNITQDDDKQETDMINEAMDWEAGGNATVTLTPNTTLKADIISSTKGAVATDVEVDLSDKSGLVESLSMSLKWGLFDINNGDPKGPKDANDKADMYVEGKLDYGIDAMGGKITPGTTVTVNQLDRGDATVGLEVRAVLTEAVPATEFGLRWKTSQLVKTNTMEADKGEVSLWTKIKY